MLRSEEQDPLDDEGLLIDLGLGTLTVERGVNKIMQPESDASSEVNVSGSNREIIKGHSELVEPMNRLMRKNLEFPWTAEAEAGFELTKERLCSAPVLALPRQEGTFILDTDASDVAISGILHQEQEVDGKLKVRPIAYGS